MVIIVNGWTVTVFCAHSKEVVNNIAEISLVPELMPIFLDALIRKGGLQLPDPQPCVQSNNISSCNQDGISRPTKL